jgi:hypothetical protein
LIITIGGPVFKVEPLGLMSWLLILLGTASVLVFAEVARYIRRTKTMPPPGQPVVVAPVSPRPATS